jgi:hypothetical protein
MRRLLVLSIVAASVTVGATTASAATWIRAAKLGRATWIR